MKPKRYFASDMSSAIKLVRDDLGPEAIILSNKKVSGGVEIISALDNIDEILSREARSSEPTVKAKATLRGLHYDRTAAMNELGKQGLGQADLGKQASNHSVTPRASRPKSAVSSVAKTSPEPWYTNHRDTNHRDTNKGGGLTRGINTAMNKGRSGNESIEPLVKETNTMKNPGRGSRGVSNIGPRSGAESGDSIAAPRSKSAFDYYHDIAEQDDSSPRVEALSDAPESDASAAGLQTDEMREMRGELIFLRKLVEKQNQAGQNSSAKNVDPSTHALRVALMKLGFSPWVIERAFERTSFARASPHEWSSEAHSKSLNSKNSLSKKTADLRAVLVGLIKNINLMNHDIVETGGCALLVGPPGAGKTTTLAKLATRRVMERGSQSVRIISLDCHRIGASQQIKAIAEVLNVDVKIQYDVGFLMQLSPQYSDPSILTLIDTAGMLPQDEYWLKQKSCLKSLPDFVKKMLVIPCSNQFVTLQSIIKNFADIGISGCILTKLDETSSMGESLSAMIQSGLEICYVANGQKIPFDLFQFDGEGLLNLLENQVGREDPGTGEFDVGIRNGSV